MNSLFAENKYYIEYETHLRHLNELMANGLGDTEEAETVRDRMDTPWNHLTEEEAKRLRGLSADLYMLQDAEIFQPSDGRTKIQIGQAVYAAIDQERWVEALELMRQPNLLPRARIAVSRAAAYKELGHLEAALLFLRYALRLNPQAYLLKALELDLLCNGSREEEARQKSAVLLSDATAPAFLRIYAAGVFTLASEHMQFSHYQDIVPALEQALQEGASTILPRVDIMAYGYNVLGFCYFKMGLAQKAHDAVQKALNLSPSEELTSLLHDLSRATPSEPNMSARYSQILTRKLPLLTGTSDANGYAEPAYAFAAA